MQEYLLSIFQPDGPPPPPERLGAIMRELEAVRAEMEDVGAFVFTNGLEAPSTATVLRVRGDEVLTTDGPFAEGKEHLGGIYVIRAQDLDCALSWGRKVARAATLPVEVRPFRG